jgi:hypothetical protein
MIHVKPLDYRNPDQNPATGYCESMPPNYLGEAFGQNAGLSLASPAEFIEGASRNIGGYPKRID